MTVVLLAIAVALVSWSNGGSAGSETALEARAAQLALGAWRSFPLGRNPRPVIVLGAGSIVLPPRPHEQVAFATGRYVLNAHLPSGPGRIAGYRLLLAAGAYRSLRANAMPDSQFHARLQIVAVKLGFATFETDRGRQRLPAWPFSARGLSQSAAVLAAQPFTLPPRPHIHVSSSVVVDTAEEFARLSQGGTKATISFVGGPAGNGPCDDNYTVRSFESATAVAYVIRHRSTRSSGGSQACSLVGQERKVTATFTRPLGRRVLIDGADALPIPAAPAGQPSR